MSQLGISVMICMLTDNTPIVKAYNKAMGKTISTIEKDEDHLTLTFDDGAQLVLWDDGQSCCESRYMTCDDDLTSFAGEKLASIELRDGPEVAESWDVHEQQFVHVNMASGRGFVVANHNEHNGYYGGFCPHLDYKEPKA